MSDTFQPSAVKLTARRVDSSPFMGPNMDHWRVTLTYQGRRMSVPFSMGYAHGGRPPKVRDVMPCLAMDAMSAEDDFSSWCASLGYEENSRKALAVYQATQRHTAAMRRVFGDDFDAACGFDWEESA